MPDDDKDVDSTEAPPVLEANVAELGLPVKVLNQSDNCWKLASLPPLLLQDVLYPLMELLRRL